MSFLGKMLLPSDSPGRAEPSPARGYGVALIATALAVLARLALHPMLGDRATYVTLYPIVIFTAWYGGLGPGLASVAAGALVAAFFLLEPLHDFRIRSRSDQLGLVAFAVTGVLSAVIGHAVRVGRRRAEAAVAESKRAEAALRAQQRHLEAITATSSVLLIHCSRDLRYVFVNAACEAFFGRPREEIVGRSIASVMGQAAFEAIRPHVERVLRGETVEYEAEVPYDRPGPRVVAVKYVPDFGPDGEVNGWFATVADVTSRKRAETALRRSEEEARARFDELQAIYETTPIGMCLIDRDLRFVRINERLAEMNGPPAAAHIGRSIREMVPLMADKVEPAFIEVLRTGLPMVDVELAGETAAQPGVQRVWLTSWYPLRQAGGRVVGVNVTAQEITERKSAEEGLKQADRRKDEFLATLGHELRNPLAPITNAVELLCSRVSPSEAPDLAAACGIIQRQTGRMARLIDDLLDISRITTGKLLLRQERTALREIVDEAVETVRPLLASREQELRIQMPAESVALQADRVRLAQVFANLLNNASKFGRTGGRIELSFELTSSPPELRASVRDDGVGIRSEFLPRLFEKFSQADPVLERSAPGLGLGLALVRGLVEMHGGSVFASSDGPGRGSEFVVRLPLVAETAAPTPSSRPARAGPDRALSPAARRILVVDDNEDSADSLAMLLRIKGHEVETAHDGRSAFATAERYRPDLVLMDIGMPDLNGYDACRRIREQVWGKDMLLVAQTGWGQERDRSRALEAGFDAHLVKPIDPLALAQLLAATPRGPAAS